MAGTAKEYQEFIKHCIDNEVLIKPLPHCIDKYGSMHSLTVKAMPNVSIDFIYFANKDHLVATFYNIGTTTNIDIEEMLKLSDDKDLQTAILFNLNLFKAEPLEVYWVKYGGHKKRI